MSGIPDSVVIADQREALESLRERLDEWEQAYRIAVNDLGAKDEIHCSCVPFLRIEINRLRGVLLNVRPYVSRSDLQKAITAALDPNRPDNRLK